MNMKKITNTFCPIIKDQCRSDCVFYDKNDDFHKCVAWAIFNQLQEIDCRLENWENRNQNNA